MFSGLSLGRRRIGLAATAAVAVGTAITIVAINGASASHAGEGLVGLSATNGTKTISWQSGGPAALTLKTDSVTDGAWSPDGSRMAFVNQNHAIETVRYNNATDTGMYANADGDARSRPTWTDDGSFLLWSTHITDPASQDIIQFGTGDEQGWSTLDLQPLGINWTHPDGGVHGTILIQGQAGAEAPNVYSLDESNLFDDQPTPTLVVENASSPAASPIDGSVAFVRSDGTNAQIWVLPAGSATPVKVTSDAKDHSNPTWSPDGKTIAFDEGTSVFTVPAAGGTLTPTGLTGVPAYQSAEHAVAARFAGENRYETAISVSQGNWADAGVSDPDRFPANAVVLSRGDTFADALGGSALAAAKQGPLLLTPPTFLFADTAKEIKRVLGNDKTKIVYLVGGTGALSTAVENAVKALPYAVVRLSGANRYETAVTVANKITLNPGAVLLATGNNFPDALSAGATAGAFDVPGTGTSAVVLLTNDAAMPTPTKSYLQALNHGPTGPQITAVGGSAVNALASLNLTNSFGISGANRYDTARIVANFFFPGAEVFGMATGTNFPDALAGGALLATLGGPLLLTPPTAVNAGVATYLDLNSAAYTAEAVFGGSSVVSDSVMKAYATAISGPQAFTPNASLLQSSTGGKSTARTQALDASPKARAQNAATRQLPDFNHLPSDVKKLK